MTESFILPDHLVELHEDFLSHEEVLRFLLEGVFDVDKVVLDVCSAHFYGGLASSDGLEDDVGDCEAQFEHLVLLGIVFEAQFEELAANVCGFFEVLLSEEKLEQKSVVLD